MRHKGCRVQKHDQLCAPVARVLDDDGRHVAPAYLHADLFAFADRAD
jgi:hypothetical protein